MTSDYEVFTFVGMINLGQDNHPMVFCRRNSYWLPRPFQSAFLPEVGRVSVRYVVTCSNNSLNCLDQTCRSSASCLTCPFVKPHLWQYHQVAGVEMLRVQYPGDCGLVGALWPSFSTRVNVLLPVSRSRSKSRVFMSNDFKFLLQELSKRKMKGMIVAIPHSVVGKLK